MRSGNWELLGTDVVGTGNLRAFFPCMHVYMGTGNMGTLGADGVGTGNLRAFSPCMYVFTYMMYMYVGEMEIWGTMFALQL